MNVSTLPDHDVVVIKTNIKPSTHKQAKRNILLYKKAEWNAICVGLQPLMDEMCINITSVESLRCKWHVEQFWDSF